MMINREEWRVLDKRIRNVKRSLELALEAVADLTLMLDGLLVDEKGDGDRSHLQDPPTVTLEGDDG